jgi:hypothetical protein
MCLASQSSTQVYSPFGSYIVEQHDTRQATFETASLPIRHNPQGALSFDQAAVGLRLQQYYPVHSVGPTPTRLQILLNILLHRRDCDAD